MSSGSTGHLEAVQVIYDPARVTYGKLLDVFWRHVDPTDPGGQFVDRGPQYGTAIFYHDEEQKRLAGQSKEELEKSGRFDKPVVTPILSLENFYPAEEYHQDYHRKSPIRYRLYRYNSGRDRFLSQAWDPEKEIEKTSSPGNRYVKPDLEALRKKLSPLQFQVTQEEGTEPPFENEHWSNKMDGIYVDVVSGEPLFSSRDKFDSGTPQAKLHPSPGARKHRGKEGPAPFHGTHRNPEQTG